MKDVYVWMMLFLLLCTITSLFRQKLRNLEKEEMDRIYFDQKHTNQHQLYNLYEFFASFLLTKNYVHKVKRRMDVYSPGNERVAAERTIRIFLVTLLFGIVMIGFILVLRPKWVIVLIFLSGIYFFNSFVVNYVINNEEMELLQHLLSFLSDIRHGYHETGMIEESILRAIHDKTPEDMRLHGMYLLEVLSSEDTQEEIKNYLDHVPNQYLKELLTLCVTVLRFGDHKLEGQSLFLTSIRNLRQSVNTEILRRKKQKHLFGGYSFILVAPIFSLPFISNWAINTMPSLKVYYEGAFGILFPMAAFVLTFILYQLNLKLQQPYYYVEKEHSIVFYLCEVEGINRLLHTMEAKNEGYKMRLEALLIEAGDTISIHELLLKKIIIAIGFFLFMNVTFLCMPGNYHWYYGFTSLACSYIASGYPVWILYYERLLVKHARMDEIMQFQSILYMLSPIPQMTPELLLSWLERFAQIFRKSISKCIDFLSSSEDEAFTKLYEEEPYEPFQRLIENLQACDRIGVLPAFDELGAERLYFQEERRQQGEMTLENKAAVGSFISMGPTLFVVIGYLFLPFILQSFSLFSMQLKQINF